MFKAPTILASYISAKMIAAIKDASVRDIQDLRLNNVLVFSPYGLVCHYWGKFTGRGDWLAGNFRFKGKDGGPFRFCSDIIPALVVNDIAPEKNNNCPLRYVLQYGSNKVKTFISVFDQMEPFELDLSKNNARLPKWRIEGLIDSKKDFSVFLTVDAETEGVAKRNFYTQYPAGLIKKVISEREFATIF